MLRIYVLFYLFVFAQFAAADFDHAMALYEKQDYPNAFSELDKLARSGDHAAQFNLGVMYYKGQSVAQDISQGYAWITLATQAGDMQWSGVRDKIYNALTDEQKRSANKVRRELNEKFSDGIVKNQEAIVIMNAVGSGHVHNIIFNMFDSDYQFSIKFDSIGPAQEIYVVHVKPGRYYVRTLGTTYANVLNTPVEQPLDINDTILVPAASVTYIGDWRAIERLTNDSEQPLRYEMTTKYSKETVVKADQLNPELRKLPLFLAKPGAPPVSLAWQ